MIEKKNKIERKDPKTRLTFAYSFEDSMSQELTESNEHDGFYDEERNKQRCRRREREEETRNAEEEDEDTERGEETENTEEEESGDTGDDESDVYSASEVVSDIDNDVLEEEGDAQDNSVNEWGAITDLTPELEACTLNESTLNIPIEDISTADESMIPWRGRLKLKQYIKNKSHKYGVKIYKLCTPEGYTYNSIIYSGKGENGREQNHGKVTVLKLIQGLENKCRIVIADNFYSSIELAEEILSHKTRYCGTLRSNRRGLLKAIVSLKLKKGEIKGAMNKNGVKIIKWVDKRQLLMISTVKEDEDVLVNTGKKNKKTNENIKKPTCVLTYNNNKKGVDFSDQMSLYYSSTLKRGLKWFRKVGMEYLFGMALVNAWITYNMKNDKVSKS
ncbi:piggyBac transposable element-derived protein 4-like [Bombyx mori]|uniref:piggyBac transposable element-derived protein 4-like n=1 Tax=Bombyx mori TaxID=7091 RepID=UPI002ED30CB5